MRALLAVIMMLNLVPVFGGENDKTTIAPELIALQKQLISSAAFIYRKEPENLKDKQAMEAYRKEFNRIVAIDRKRIKQWIDREKRKQVRPDKRHRDNIKLLIFLKKELTSTTYYTNMTNCVFFRGKEGIFYNADNLTWQHLWRENAPKTTMKKKLDNTKNDLIVGVPKMPN